MIALRINFRPGIPLYEQIVYAAKKAIISGRLRPGDPFPSVRAISKELKINPNTAHKVVTQLIAAGLSRRAPAWEPSSPLFPNPPRSSAPNFSAERSRSLTVEAMRLGIDLENVVASITEHWKHLNAGNRGDIRRQGGRKRWPTRFATENLSKKFRSVEAVKALNLDIPEGAIYTLLGPNGAGKTTTIKVLMNIFEATSGRAEVLGIDSRQIRGRAFEQIGYMSENQQMPGWMHVDAFLAYLRPFYPAWDADLENELVKSFDLPLNRKLKHLSRGMRMKAALAGALAYHPKLIVLDEPFGGLDPLVRDELIEALLERATEATIFISSHDLAEVESFASHVGYIENGQLRFSEDMAALTARFREVEVALGAPAAPVPSWPGSWLQVNQSASVVQFVESRFDAERTHRKFNASLERFATPPTRP